MADLKWRDSEGKNPKKITWLNSDNLDNLERVIRQVDNSTRTNNSHEKIVIIDTNTGLEKRSFLAKNVKYYLISNSINESNCAIRDDLKCQVKDFENDFNFSLSINYRVSCEPGNETRVAEALWNSSNPREELDLKIRKYVNDYFSCKGETSDIISNFSSVIKQLNKYLSDKVEREIGLNIKLRITLKQEDELIPFRISSPRFFVQFSDYTEELDLQFELELLVDEDNKTLAVLNSGQRDSLSQLAQKEIKKYLLENVSVEKFYGELNSSVRQGLKLHLDKALTTYGRKVGYLALKTEAISSKVEEFLKVEHQVVCQVQGESIPVKNMVLIMPENLGKYRVAGSPNLEVWVKRNLEIIIQPILFNKQYIDILLNFAPIKKEVEAKMGERAKSIGYTVQQIVSIPELEPLKLTKDFPIEVTGTFDTKDYKVKAKLNIVIDAKIEDLQKIESLLNSRIDVKASMQTAIERTVRSFLHTVEPERFYVRFFTTDNGHPEEKFSVEKELENLIEQELENEPFFATIKNVTPKPLETEVTERYQKLYKRFSNFEVDVLPFEGVDEVRFTGILQVEGVHKDSWYIFQSRNYELEEIKSYFEQCIKAKLKNYPNKALEYKETKDRAALEELLNQWGQQCIVDQFGLEISIKNVDREHTSSEKIKADNVKKIIGKQGDIELVKALNPLELQEQEIQYNKEVLTEVREAKKLQLQGLLERRAILIKRSGNEEEIKEIDHQIYELTSNIEGEATKCLVQSSQEISSLVEVKESTELSFSQILEQQKRLSSSSHQSPSNPTKIIKSLEDKHE